jgi:hypothetical protein
MSSYFGNSLKMTDSIVCGKKWKIKIKFENQKSVLIPENAV